MQLGASGYVVPTGIDQRSLGDILPLLIDRFSGGANEILHLRCVQVVTRLHLLQQAGNQVNRLDLIQTSTGFALTPRGADRIVDERIVTHGFTS